MDNEPKVKQLDSHQILEDMADLAEFIAMDYAENKSKLNTLQLANRFARLHAIEASFAAAHKVIKAVFEDMKTKTVPAAFELDEIGSLTLADKSRVTISHIVYASIKEGQKSLAFQWLRDNDLGGLIVETVNAQSLSSAARDVIKQNKDMPEEIFNVHQKANTSLTKG